MGRRLRFIPPGGALVEVTCRTIQGRFLLRPTQELREIIIGILGRALRRYPVNLHAFVFMSNHYHLLMSVPDAQRLARFMGYVNSNLAREVARLASWHDKVWSRRYQAIVVSNERETQVARLKYILSHGVKEGLVGQPEQWPGAHSVQALRSGDSLHGLWFNRTMEWAAQQRGENVEHRQFATLESFKLTPLPCWAHLSHRVWCRYISEILSEISERHRLSEAQGVAVLHDLDSSLNQESRDGSSRLKKSSAPLFHCTSRAARKELQEAYCWFLQAYREAVKMLRSGNLLATFPEGSFAPPFPAQGANLTAVPA